MNKKSKLFYYFLHTTFIGCKEVHVFLLKSMKLSGKYLFCYLRNVKSEKSKDEEVGKPPDNWIATILGWEETLPSCSRWLSSPTRVANLLVKPILVGPVLVHSCTWGESLCGMSAAQPNRNDHSFTLQFWKPHKFHIIS